MKSKLENNRPKSGGEGYETSDADTVSVALAAVLVLLMAFLVALVAAGFFQYFSRRALSLDERATPAASAMAAGQRQFPEPRLQVAPEEDLKAFRNREEAELQSYGWIDKQTGVVRIPIERAMDLLVEKGLPVRGQPGASPPQRTDLQLQQERPLQSTLPKQEGQ